MELPASRVVRDRGFVSGGERALYELATAAAVLGYDVELRGELNATVLDLLTAAAGAAPRVDLPARPPVTGEIVVVPEAADLRLYATVQLSGAKPLMLVLAPPGLSGWSFLFDWELPDPRTVPVDAVGTPASFRAIAALGYAMWTNSLGTTAAGKAAGTDVRWIGTGNPVPYPPVPDKTHDIAVIEANRWGEWAIELAERVPGASVLRVPFQPDVYSLCESLAPARLLMWPSRLEGRSRVPREARAVGTVPVALDTNPFALRDDHGGGVVLLPDLDSLPLEAARLLAHPEEIEALAADGMRSVREQTAWEPFVERVREGLAELVASPLPADAEARNELGCQLRDLHLERRAAAVDPLRAELEQLATTLAVEQAALIATRDDLAAAGEALDTLTAELGRATTAARTADARAEAAEELVAAYRSRRVVRLADSVTRRRGDGARAEGAERDG